MKNLKIFSEFKTFSAGVQYFIPEDEKAYAAGKPCKGFGSVRYAEGSVYCGELYFDGKRYNKLGFGRQDFMLSELGTYNPERKLRRAFYAGSFDYRETDWIYGDGIMYYVDENNRPARFVKGFYSGVNRVAEYSGDFSADCLAQGFTPDMEGDFDEWHDVLFRMYSKKDGLKGLKNLFIGDSYFEFWCIKEFCGTEFYDSFDGSENLNIGVGGTRFGDWIMFLDKLRDMPVPQRIFLNLGFNDIHSNRSAESVYKDYISVLGILRERFPQVQIVLLNVVKAPSMGAYWAEEEKFNALTKSTADELGVKILDMREAIAAASGVFYGDDVHLNENGYKIMTDKIKSVI